MHRLTTTAGVLKGILRCDPFVRFLKLVFYRHMLSFEMIWRTTLMLHGEGGKVARDASYCEDSGFENSPVLNRLFDQSSLFFMSRLLP